MLEAINNRAPVWRNQAAMQFWFDAWNADNERAREAYDENMLKIENQAAFVAKGQVFPRICNANKHPLLSDKDVRGGRCKRCRNSRERARRRGELLDPPRRLRKITPEKEFEIIRLYSVEKLGLHRVAGRLGVSHTAVWKILVRTNTPLRTQSEAALLRRKNNTDD